MFCIQQIIELKAGGVPWKEHLYELEKQEGLEGAIKFCLYEVRGNKTLVSRLSHQQSAFFELALAAFSDLIGTQPRRRPAIHCSLLPR